MSKHADVNCKGDILLGDKVVCDGYARNAKIRVQSHAHTDHLRKLTGSLLKHDVVMHPVTRDIVRELEPSLQRRLQGGKYSTNLHLLPYGEEVNALELDGGFKITLLNAKHLIGSAQVVVTYPDGWRAAYSGDIGFNACPPVDIDELVVDASISIHEQAFSRDDVFESLYKKVREEMQAGKDIALFGHFGVLQEALNHLHMTDALWDGKVYGSKKDIALRQVFINNNLDLPEIHACEYWRDDNSTQKVQLYGHGRPLPAEGFDGALFHLGRMGMTRPLKALDNNHWQVAISNHSNLQNTVDYVADSGAKRVVIDTFRCKSETAIGQLESALQGLDINVERATECFTAD